MLCSFSSPFVSLLSLFHSVFSPVIVLVAVCRHHFTVENLSDSKKKTHWITSYKPYEIVCCNYIHLFSFFFTVCNVNGVPFAYLRFICNNNSNKRRRKVCKIQHNICVLFFPKWKTILFSSFLPCYFIFCFSFAHFLVWNEHELAQRLILIQTIYDFYHLIYNNWVILGLQVFRAIKKSQTMLASHSRWIQCSLYFTCNASIVRSVFGISIKENCIAWRKNQIHFHVFFFLFFSMHKK